VDAQGNRNFPNAQVAIAEADLRFWTDDANIRGPAFMEPFIRGAQKNLNAYRDRMVMVQDGRAGYGADMTAVLRTTLAEGPAARAEAGMDLRAKLSLGEVDVAGRIVLVRAPFDGEIAERTINVGEYVTPQRAVVTLVRTNPLRMELQVPQERLGMMRRVAGFGFANGLTEADDVLMTRAGTLVPVTTSAALVPATVPEATLISCVPAAASVAQPVRPVTSAPPICTSTVPEAVPARTTVIAAAWTMKPANAGISKKSTVSVAATAILAPSNSKSNMISPGKLARSVEAWAKPAVRRLAMVFAAMIKLLKMNGFRPPGATRGYQDH
jgi:hypothetical protein